MSHPARSNPPGATSPPIAAERLRVVLVGNTGLDQSLRREPSLELYRARSSFEAVGELGTPLGPDSPNAAVVIVAPGTVTQEEVTALARALRRLDPEVCIVGLLDSTHSRNLAPDPKSFGLDAWLVPPVSAGVLRLLVLNRGVTSEGDHFSERAAATSDPPPASAAAEPESVLVTAPVAAPAVPVSTVVMSPQPVPPAPEPARQTRIAQPSADLVSALGTAQPPLQALLAGGDVVTACLSVLRARGGSLGECAFLSGPGTPSPAASSPGVPVVHKGHSFGVLTAPDPTPELEPAARWLASWLALREQQSQLRRAAFTDPLTGAWNRRYFDGFLARALAEAKASRHDVSLLLFDIDDFKQYNDRFGHAAGDEILVAVVGLLRSVVRASDRVCRLGGDEFAVIFHEPTGPREPGSHHPASILTLARRFQKQVAQTQFRKLGNDARASLGVSGGLATFPWDGHDAESLLEHADRLLCESKSKGKNVIRLGPEAERTLGPGESPGSE